MMGIREIVLFFGVILSNVVRCLATDVCYDSNNNNYVYCKDGYYCCRGNSECCSEGISTAAIIGITIAAVAFIAICFVWVLVTAKKKKAAERRIEPRVNNTQNIQNISVINQPPYGQHSAPSPSYPAQQNYFVANYPQAPPPYTASYPPPPAYSATE